MSIPRLVLIHGFAGLPEVWRPVVSHLPAELRELVIAPAVAGHGIAEPAIGPASFATEVERLALLLDSADPTGPMHLAGYSLGGRLALGLLAAHPDRFSGATLIGTNPGLATEGDGTARRVGDETWARQLEDQGLDAFLDAWESQPLFATQSPEQRRCQRHLRARLDAPALAAALRALGLAEMPDYRSRLAALELPVTLVAGEADAKFAHLAREMAGLLPAGQVRIVPGVGHNVVLEAPEAVARILTDALEAEAAPRLARAGTKDSTVCLSTAGTQSVRSLNDTMEGIADE